MKTRHERLIHPWNLPNSTESDIATGRAQQTRQLTPAERKARKRWLWRMHHPHYGQEYYWRDVEVSRARNRAYYQRNRDKINAYRREYKRKRHATLKATEPLAYECMLEYWREEYAKRREQICAYEREYYANNREKILARKRMRRAEQTGHYTGYVSREDRTQRARAREAWIVMLRGEGLPWKEIAKRVGYKANSCQNIYTNAMKRRGQQQINREKRLARQRERDAFLLSSYREGMSWKEYAQIVGCNTSGGARTVYYDALDRATRPEQQGTQQSA